LTFARLPQVGQAMETLIGLVAAFCTTIVNVPHAKRLGSEQSLLENGVVNNERAVANGASFVLLGILRYFSCANRRRRPAQVVARFVNSARANAKQTARRAGRTKTPSASF
jgi:hypothetical protein